MISPVGNNIGNHGRDRRQRLAQPLFVTKNSSFGESVEQMAKFADPT